MLFLYSRAQYFIVFRILRQEYESSQQEKKEVNFVRQPNLPPPLAPKPAMGVVTPNRRQLPPKPFSARQADIIGYESPCNDKKDPPNIYESYKDDAVGQPVNRDNFSFGDNTFSGSEIENIYENDLFYKNYGYDSTVQESLYEKTFLSKANTEKKLDIKKLNAHLQKFIDSEIKYCSDIKEFKNLLQKFKMNNAFKYVTQVYKVHQNINLEKYKHKIDVATLAQIFINNISSLECYVSLIVETKNFEEDISNLPLDRHLASSYLVDMRKRLHICSMQLKTWSSDFKLSMKEDNTVSLAASKLIEICRTADSMLIIDSVENSPIQLQQHGHLLKHTDFIIEGKNFSKSITYKVLLFSDWIVVTKSLGTKSLKYFDGFHFENIKLVNDESTKKIKLKINYGERRSSETLKLNHKTEATLAQWREEIAIIVGDVNANATHRHLTMSQNMK